MGWEWRSLCILFREDLQIVAHANIFERWRSMRELPGRLLPLEETEDELEDDYDFGTRGRFGREDESMRSTRQSPRICPRRGLSPLLVNPGDRNCRGHEATRNRKPEGRCRQDDHCGEPVDLSGGQRKTGAFD
jgi:hypothetical protein